MKTEQSPPPSRVDLLDYARFLAAMAVVLYHFTYWGILSNQITSIEFIPYLSEISKYGYLGVEFFFMISGYVIFYSAKNTKASTFATARLLRLYPAFLCALLITSTVIFLWGMAEYKVYASQFLFNLTMVPEAFGRHPIDGSYWTLALEIQFYGLIFLMLIFGLGKRLEAFFLAWPVLILLASFAGGKDWLLVGGYFSYFAVGALFAMKRIRSDWLINILIALCLYLSLHFSAGSHLKQDDLTMLSPTIISFIISAFYLFFFSLTFEKVCSISLPKANLAGAITYPLYLIHQVIGCMVISRFANDQNKISIVISTALFCLILAFLLNKYVERGLKYFWKNFFDKMIGAPIRGIESKMQTVKAESSLVS
jgi:peptidoglycan/LPS O-acetylase OafA/YrhL